MTTWIFQCNPDHYNIDQLLASNTREILFAANQNARKMTPGDTVYLWRSQGKEKAIAGIVAKGKMVASPIETADDGPDRIFWKDQSSASERRLRTKVRIDEVANKKEVIQRGWLLEDPVLSDLTILKMANSSNYIVEGTQKNRIEKLWQNTGETWTRAQSLAALKVYDQTYGGSLSQLPGSPISETAVLIGRAVKGVYNKVLNFRHIDPRDSRAGFSGSGAGDLEVWDEFFDPAANMLNTDALDSEFDRLWGQAHELELDAENEDYPHTSNQNTDQRCPIHKPAPVPTDREYTVSSKKHDKWYVYVLELSNKQAVKVGMSHEPKSRLREYNKMVLSEITGIKWSLAFTQTFEDAETALRIEQAVLNAFTNLRLASNGEVLRGVGTMTVQLEIVRQTAQSRA